MQAFQLCAFVLFVLSQSASGLYFHVFDDTEKCLLEELSSDSLVVGNYKSLDQPANPPSGIPEIGVLVRVHDPSEHKLVDFTTRTHGRFAFHSTEAGLHRICFTLNISSSQYPEHRKMRLELDLTVNEGDTDYEALAKQDHLTGFEVRVLKLAEKVRGIQHDVAYFKARERDFRDLSENTNSRTMWFSIVQMVVMVVLTVLQARHLRKFFTAKKVV